MKYKQAIKKVFEQEEKKEVMHIKALEKQILSKIQQEKELNQEVKTYFPHQNSFWTSKLPYAFAVIVLAILFFGLSTNSQVMAKGSIFETLINLKNQLQQELTNLLSNDPSYRDKSTQKYKQAQKEWCSISARSPEEQEKAVAAIRDFLDRPDANVEYECATRNPNKPNEKPRTESYIVDFDRFIVSRETNQIIEMLPKEGAWGENKDGSRWISPQKEYDYTARYTQSEVEQLARDFASSHEKSIGKIDLNRFTLASDTKDDGNGRISYSFIWKDEKQKLTITFTQGGQLVTFFNGLIK